MDWETELLDILESVDAKELASVLISKFGEVAKLNEEGYRHIGITLQRLEEVVAKGNENMNAALWMAFWLGAAWEKAVRDASEC